MRFFLIYLVLLRTLAFGGDGTFTVTGTVSISRKKGAGRSDQSNVVVWLKQVGVSTESKAAASPPRRFEIRQTHKRFEPHILAVPAGSVVSFPNLDPFFHNVFSLFDGNRFDLGLYEAGASQSAKFDRPGISFIFCNIHPEMSAVVVVVDGPFAVSDSSGAFSISKVPPGRYRVNVWHERARSAPPQAPAPEVTITGDNTVVPAISLLDSGALVAPHKNKYGRDYLPPVPGPVYK